MGIASLAEVDAMVATLGDLYAPDPETVGAIQDRRRTFNAGLFKMLEARRR